MDKLKNIIDSKNNSHEVEKPLGEGSQGVTYLLKNNQYIAKLFKGVGSETELKSKINFLIQLDLDKHRFAVPLREITAPRVGYISEFASGMVPLNTYMQQGKGQKFMDWYSATGGHFKRYAVLIKLAMALRTLHAKGLVYCDLSPNNVFISENNNSHNIFLIDMDNLRYKTSIFHNIYTPRYGAPEVVKNIAPNTQMSDCFSFAVIAYQLLTCSHPLIGDMVSEGEPELEEKALRGELPWVEDSKDDSNCRKTGLPSAAFLSRNLVPLFQKTFEVGLNNPEKRPTIYEWVDALNEALNELLYCPICEIYYPYKNFHHCPHCGNAPQLPLSLKIRRWGNTEYYDRPTDMVKSRFELQQGIMDEIIVDENTPKTLKAFHLLCTFDDYDTPLAQLKVRKDGESAIVTIIPLNDYDILYKIPSQNKEGYFSKEETIRFRIQEHPSMILGVKEFTKPQRVLVL